jgi:hypothetical protein
VLLLSVTAGLIKVLMQTPWQCITDRTLAIAGTLVFNSRRKIKNKEAQLN